jgi:hypothetical protein
MSGEQELQTLFRVKGNKAVPEGVTHQLGAAIKTNLAHN